MFVVEDETVRSTDVAKCLCAVDLVGVDVVADKGKVFVKKTSSVMLREA